jgi:hypothetical protein
VTGIKVPVAEDQLAGIAAWCSSGHGVDGVSVAASAAEDSVKRSSQVAFPILGLSPAGLLPLSRAAGPGCLPGGVRQQCRALGVLAGRTLAAVARLTTRAKSLVRTVAGGHQDLPSDRREYGTAAITRSDRVRWPFLSGSAPIDYALVVLLKPSFMGGSR